VVRRVFRSPTTVVGATIILLMLGMAIFAPLLVEPNVPSPYQMPRDWSAIDVPPGSPGHILGTTPTGGDVLYGIVWGARSSLRLAFTVVAITLTIGITVGSIAGYLGGRVDDVLMRIVDVFMTLPELILALAIAAVLGPSFRNIILALAVVGWTQYARVVRGEIMTVRLNEYVDASRVAGESRRRIFLQDVLPNALTPIIVLATLDLGKVVLVGAALSYIGLAEAGLAEWGNLVSEGSDGVVVGRWWVATFAGAMVFLWALSFNLVGDGLRDALDPKMEGR
jgi:peptide/nickel transport system permease protein